MAFEYEKLLIGIAPETTNDRTEQLVAEKAAADVIAALKPSESEQQFYTGNFIEKLNIAVSGKQPLTAAQFIESLRNSINGGTVRQVESLIENMRNLIALSEPPTLKNHAILNYFK